MSGATSSWKQVLGIVSGQHWAGLVGSMRAIVCDRNLVGENSPPQGMGGGPPPMTPTVLTAAPLERGRPHRLLLPWPEPTSRQHLPSPSLQPRRPPPVSRHRRPLFAPATAPPHGADGFAPCTSPASVALFVGTSDKNRVLRRAGFSHSGCICVGVAHSFEPYWAGGCITRLCDAVGGC